MTARIANLMTRTALVLTLCLIRLQPSTPTQSKDSNYQRAKSNPTLVAQARIEEGYGKLPLSFEANQGQPDPQVKFLARGRGYNLFLSSQEAVLVLNRSHALRARSWGTMPLGPIQLARDTPRPTPTVLRMQLVGANLAPRVTACDELPGESHYFIGNDPPQWRTHIAHFGKVKYQSVYPGVDLFYYGNQGQLEYDFVVGPGADPRAIKIEFPGARRVRLNTRGEVLLSAGDAEIRYLKPLIYQEVEGVRKEIAGRYRIDGQTQLSFEVGSYDVTRPLVIDPVLLYATYLGGSGDDLGSGIAVDEEGFAYVAGVTTSLNFPTTAAGFQPANAGSQDVFVTKLNRKGTDIIYSTYLGGSGLEATVAAVGLAVDRNGNAYVTGNTTSTDFPITPDAFQSTFAGGDADTFVTKLNRTGTALVYSTYLGGSECGNAAAICFDVGFAIAVDDTGNAYVAGPTNSTDFPTTPGAFQSAFAGGFSDTFVTKLNRNGTDLVYSTYLGGSSFDPARGIAIDKAGNAYVTGPTGSPDFPTTRGAFQPAFAGGDVDVFVTKLNRRGTALVYSTYLGGSGFDFTNVNGIAVNENGNAYAAGLTDSLNFPTTPGALQAANAGAEDAYVTKLNRSGTALIYSTYLGGSGFDGNNGIAVGKGGSAYLIGQTDSLNFPTTPSAFQTTNAGAEDAYVAKLNRSGTALIYSSYLGGSGNDFGNGIAVDRAGNAYVTGQTDSLDLPTAPNIFQPANGGSSDAFVAKIGHDQKSGDGDQDDDGDCDDR